MSFVSKLIQYTKACSMHEQGKLQTKKLIKLNYQQSQFKSFISKVPGSIQQPWQQTQIFHLVDCWLAFLILIFRPFLITKWSTDFRFSWQWAEGGCDWTAEDAHSSMTPDPISIFCRGPYFLCSYFFLVFLLTFALERCSLSPHFFSRKFCIK